MKNKILISLMAIVIIIQTIWLFGVEREVIIIHSCLHTYSVDETEKIALVGNKKMPYDASFEKNPPDNFIKIGSGTIYTINGVVQSGLDEHDFYIRTSKP